MRKLFAFYMLIICIENVFAQATIESDVHKDAREDGVEFFQIIIVLIVFFGLVWIISKIVKSYSNKKEIKKSQRRYKIQNKENGNWFINGHECVDLGLGVKWANCNIGAENPSDYGDYFAWGETKTKSEYTSINSVTYGKDMGSIAEDPLYDVARANWGGTWRLPTEEEIEELVSKCKCEWTTRGGHNGYKITGPNGNSIFLPAAGWHSWLSLQKVTGPNGNIIFYHAPSSYFWPSFKKMIGPDGNIIFLSADGSRNKLKNAGEYGRYWSASPVVVDMKFAVGLFFDSGNCHRTWGDRHCGYSIRPVME